MTQMRIWQLAADSMTDSHKVAETGNGKMSVSSNRPRTVAAAGGATQEGALPMSDQHTAARDALAAHDALRATYGIEPPSDSEGMPYDHGAWLAWHKDVKRPAFERWSQAMDALDAALGQKISRHPFNFRPICEEILSYGE